MSRHLNIKFASRSSRGKVKANNQDYLEVNTDILCGAIADGISGNAYGEIASQLAVQSCLEYLLIEQEALDQQPTKELANAIKVANEVIITVQQNEAKYSKMGSTLTCFRTSGSQLDYAWVGDSRIYLISAKHNEISLLTKDHTLDKSKIDARFAPKLHQRAAHILTQMVGSILLLKPDVGSHPIKQGDLVLACTDGLSNQVPDELILAYTNELLTSHKDGLEKLADKLLDRALDCGGHDNISFILASIQ